MCGVAGVYISSKRSVHYDPLSLVKKIVASQYTRGPDNQDIHVHTGSRVRMFFGHNRLSIIDLSKHANQPMWDENDQYCLIFNGEIYNYLELRAELSAIGYKFTTSSDAEVLLKSFIEWGEDSVNHFNGMFAFAIFDCVSEKIWLFRDRFGVKPLYYYVDDNGLCFASTGKIIAEEIGLKPNLNYISQGLLFGFYDDNSSISQYDKLSALPSGHYLRAYVDSEGKLNTQVLKYYDLEKNAIALVDSLATQTFSSLLESLSEIFIQAVKFRLRSDVPVGVSLSGGLDSSSVAAIASKQHENIIGFTLGDPQNNDTEGPLVRELVNKLGIKVNYINPDPKELTQAFLHTLEAQDAPFSSLSIVAQNLVYKTAHEDGIKVLLGGQGGDESFLGYRKFFMFYLLELIKAKKIPQAFMLLSNLIPMFMKEFSKVSLYWCRRKRYLNKDGDKGALRLPCVDNVNFGFNNFHSLRQRQVNDILRFSLPTLLRYEDRNSMNWSIESRLPFLDYRLVEFAIALPASLKISHGYGKWILRQMSKDNLPKSICFARNKRGFDVNNGLWIGAGLGRLIRETIESKAEAIKDYLPLNFALSDLYSDENLTTKPQSLSEAISLVWLASKLIKN